MSINFRRVSVADFNRERPCCCPLPECLAPGFESQVRDAAVALPGFGYFSTPDPLPAVNELVPVFRTLTETSETTVNETITSSSRYRSGGATLGTANLTISKAWASTSYRTLQWGKQRGEWDASEPVGLYGYCPPLSEVAAPAKPSALSAAEGLGDGVDPIEGMTGWILSWAEVRPLDPTFVATEEDPGPRYLGGYILDGEAVGSTYLTDTSRQIFLADGDSSCRQFSVGSDTGWSEPFYFHGGVNSCCPLVDPNVVPSVVLDDFSPWYSDDGLASTEGETFSYTMSLGETSDSASGTLSCDDFPSIVGGLVTGGDDGPTITTTVDELTEDGWDSLSVWPYEAEEITEVEAEEVELENVSATDVVMGTGSEIVSATLTVGTLKIGNLVFGNLTFPGTGPAKTLSGGTLKFGTLSGGGLSGGTLELGSGTLSGGTLTGGKVTGTNVAGSTAADVSLDGATEETEGFPEEDETSAGWYSAGSSISKRRAGSFRRNLSDDVNQGMTRLGTEFTRAQGIAGAYGVAERWGKTYPVLGSTVPGAFAKGTYPVWGNLAVYAVELLFRQMRYRWSVSTEIPGLYKIVWSIGAFSQQHVAWRAAYYAWAVQKYDFLHKPAPGDDDYPVIGDFTDNPETGEDEAADGLAAAIAAIYAITDPGAAPTEPSGAFAPVVVTADLEWEWTPAQGERIYETVGVCDPTYSARVPQPPVLPEDPTEEESEDYAAAWEAYNDAIEARQEASKRQSEWYVVTPTDYFRDVVVPSLPAPLPTDPAPTSEQIATHARQTLAHTTLKAEYDAIPRKSLQVCDVRYVCNPNGPAGEIVTYDLGFPQTEIPPLDPENENPRLWTAWWT